MYSIKYYNGKKLDCIKVFDNLAEFESWKNLEIEVGNDLKVVSEKECICRFA